MEDFIKDWFYLIIIAVVGIASSFGKKRKEKGVQNKQETPSPQDWLGELFGEKKQELKPAVRPAPNIKSKPETQKHKPSYQGINPIVTFMNSENEGVRSLEVTENEMIDYKEDNFAFTLDDMPKDSEQWKKAIIYNEVFNRKY